MHGENLRARTGAKRNSVRCCGPLRGRLGESVCFFKMSQRFFFHNCPTETVRRVTLGKVRDRGTPILLCSRSAGYWWGLRPEAERPDPGPEREGWDTPLPRGPTATSPGDLSPTGHPGDGPGACPAWGLGSLLPGPGNAQTAD